MKDEIKLPPYTRLRQSNDKLELKFKTYKKCLFCFFFLNILVFLLSLGVAFNNVNKFILIEIIALISTCTIFLPFHFILSAAGETVVCIDERESRISCSNKRENTWYESPIDELRYFKITSQHIPSSGTIASGTYEPSRTSWTLYIVDKMFSRVKIHDNFDEKGLKAVGEFLSRKTNIPFVR
ncbi:MAG: hypothetical protein ACFFCS_07340 [Candidatus Hodarchaeota archaeon]